jgi:hypothetical protein
MSLRMMLTKQGFDSARWLRHRAWSINPRSCRSRRHDRHALRRSRRSAAVCIISTTDAGASACGEEFMQVHLSKRQGWHDAHTSFTRSLQAHAFA